MNKTINFFKKHINVFKIIILIIFPQFLLIASSLFLPRKITTNPIGSMILMLFSMLIIPFLLYKQFFHLSELFKPIKFKTLIYSLLFIFFAMSFSSNIQLLISNYFLNGQVMSTNYLEGLSEFFRFNSFFAFFLIAIIAPIQEEFYFRGVISSIRHSMPYKYFIPIYIFLSGLIFALGHFDFPRIPYLMLIGCFFAIVFLLTENLFYTMISHFIINSIAFLSYQFVMKNADSSIINEAVDLSSVSSLSLSMQIGVLVFLGGLIYLVGKKLYLIKNEII